MRQRREHRATRARTGGPGTLEIVLLCLSQEDSSRFPRLGHTSTPLRACFSLPHGPTASQTYMVGSVCQGRASRHSGLKTEGGHRNWRNCRRGIHILETPTDLFPSIGSHPIDESAIVLAALTPLVGGSPEKQLQRGKHTGSWFHPIVPGRKSSPGSRSRG